MSAAIPQTVPCTRAAFLRQLAGGAGSIAMAQLFANGNPVAGSESPALNGGLHHPAKVRRIIQLFMNGGASPMDTFDYKPALEKHCV